MRLLLIVALCLFAALPARAERLTIFAAASLTNVMNALIKDYHAQSSADIRVSYAASSVLARQIENGAPADVFVSANVAWINHLQQADAIVPETRQVLASNGLAFIAHRDDQVERFGEGGSFVIAQPNALAIGDPAHVPVGIYARQALVTINHWDRLKDMMVYAPNARAATALVERRATRFGITYLTDALASDQIQVLLKIDPKAHDPILYEAAVTRHGIAVNRSAVSAFLTFLSGPRARRRLSAFGFGPVDTN